MIQKHFNLFRSELSKGVAQSLQNVRRMPDTLQFEANIVDDSNVHARASLYIYLNGAVSASSFVNDHTLTQSVALWTTHARRRLLDKLSERAVCGKCCQYAT